MQREEKCQRVQTDYRHFLESLAVLVSGPNRFIESQENAIKDRVREILAESKDQALVFDSSYFSSSSYTSIPFFLFFFPFSLSLLLSTIITENLSSPSPDYSKSSREGEHGCGISEPTERTDRGDSGQDAKLGCRAVGIGGESSKDGGPVDRLRAGQGTFSKGQANGG